MPPDEPNIPELADPLPDDVLAAIGRLPAKPEGVTLEGPHCVLRPFDVADGPELFAISHGGPVSRFGREVGEHDAELLVWRFMPDGPWPDEATFTSYWQALAEQRDARTFTVVDRANGELLGSLSLLANRPADLKVELGAIWYTPPAQASVVNTECNLLVLDHVFGLGYQRAEWKCNARNERSRRAALRLGYTFEGIQDGHMIAKGRNRDTAWFRILAAEWPDRRARLQQAIRP